MQTGTGLLFKCYLLPSIKELTDTSRGNMFYSLYVLLDKLLLVLSQPENCKNENSITPQADFIPLDLQNVFCFFVCIKLDLHLNVNTVCGLRRVCVLYSTPRSQQT